MSARPVRSVGSDVDGRDAGAQAADPTDLASVGSRVGTGSPLAMRRRAWIALSASALLAVLLGATRSAPAGETVLPRSSVGEDPAWLGQLPEPVLPLPKPALRASRSPSLLVEEPRAVTARGEEVAAEGAAPGPERPLAVRDPEPRPPPTATAPAEPALRLEGSPEVPVAGRLARIEGTRQDVEVPPEGSARQAPPEVAAASGEPLAPSPEVVATASASVSTAPLASPADRAPSYRWHVQLLAGRSRPRVESDRDLFRRRYASMLEGLVLQISRPSFGDARDDFFRLRALEWTSWSEAAAWCRRLRARGHACMVARVVIH